MSIRQYYPNDNKIRVKQCAEPWINNKILSDINKREKVLRDFKMTKDPPKYDEYKSFRNDVKKAVDRAEVDYYKENLQRNKNNPNKLWQTIKQLGSSKTTKTQI